MSGIQHLIKGNQNREGRVDKIETDRFNSIVEKISGVNPSKLAAEVTGKGKAEADAFDHLQPAVAQVERQMVEATMPSMPSAMRSASPGQRPDAHVNFLAQKVAMLERQLAKYETFNGQDNDVVSTTNTQAKKLSRGADSSAMGSNVIRKKNAKTKDPVDGKPDGPPTQKQPEAQMAGEHVNILGLSMTEWREMTGLKAPPVDLTARPAVEESYEDEDDNLDEAKKETLQQYLHRGGQIKKTAPGMAAGVHDTYGRHGQGKDALSPGGYRQDKAKAAEAMEAEHQLWVNFLENYDMTPDEFSAFVEAADEAGDEEALVTVMNIEDEFQEALASYMGEAASTPAGRAALRDIGVKQDEPKPPPIDAAARAKMKMKPLAAPKGGSTPDSRGALKGISAMHAMRRGANEAVEHQLWAEFLENYDMTPEEFSAFVDEADEAGDETALATVMEIENEFQEAVSAYVDASWSQWLEARGLSVETFDGLVEAIETEDDLIALEDLQAMFEADIAGRRIAGGSPVPGGEAEINEPGKAPVKTVSLARGDIKPSRKGNFSLPAAMRAKMGLPREEGETFECDDDGSGHPNMNHKSWAKTLKRWSDSGKKGRK